MFLQCKLTIKNFFIPVRRQKFCIQEVDVGEWDADEQAKRVDDVIDLDTELQWPHDVG